jgi:hypothetical protein
VISSSRIAAVLAWASQRGSALQALAIIGCVASAIGWLLGHLTNTAALEACLAMALLWVIGTWLQRH